MDCFYAAIEMRERPELAGQPIAVGGSSERRGVLSTCNYIARQYGVRSAMPTYLALQRCPPLIVLPVRFDLYRRDSARIHEIFSRWTDLIEPLSLDEAYLDVTHRDEEGAAIAAAIRRTIFAETGLTASAGIAPNKLLAKIASDWNKPNGQFEIPPEEIASLMEDLPVRRLSGVGSVAGKKMASLGIETCGQLAALSRFELHDHFGKWGSELYDRARGIDDRPVEPDRERKSLSTETTYLHDLTTLAACEGKLAALHDDLLADLRKAEIKEGPRAIHKLFVKIRFSDFSRTTAERIGSEPEMSAYLELLAEAFSRKELPVRLMGLGVRFEEVPMAVQLWLPF